MKVRYRTIIVIVILVSVFVWEKVGYILHQNETIAVLKKSKTAIVVARVENVHQVHKTKKLVIEYSYEYDEKKFDDEKVLEQEIDTHSGLKASYPVLISTSKPEVSLLLFYRDDFKKFGLNFPDSLK